MKKELLIVFILLFYVVNCYSSQMIRVTHKWLYYHPSKEIRVIIQGIDENGNECSVYKTLPPEEFFPNGYIYEYEMFNVNEWSGTQLIYKKDGKYYVVGFTVFETLHYADHIEAHLSPCFLFDWGFDIEQQKIYLNIDYARCPEIDGEQVKPFSMKLLKEKIICTKINGDDNTQPNIDLEEMKTYYYINLSK